MKKLTFQSLYKGLKGKPPLNIIAEDLSILFSSVVSLMENPATSSITVFITALAEKDKLIDLGKTVLNAIINQQPIDYSGRMEQMKKVIVTPISSLIFAIVSFPIAKYKI